MFHINIKQRCYHHNGYFTRCRHWPVHGVVPEAKAREDGFLSHPAAATRARVREEPLRCGPGTQGAVSVPQPFRNTGIHHTVFWFVAVCYVVINRTNVMFKYFLYTTTTI